MVLNPMLAGQDLTPTFFNNTIDNARSLKYLTADLTRNNTTTFLDSTDLTIAVVANSAYIFDSCLLYDSSTAADVKIRLTVPTGAAALTASWAADITTTSIVNGVNQQGIGVVSGAITWPGGGAGSGTIMSMRPVGWISIGGTAGNLVIGFAQNTAAAVNTLLKQGSWFSLTRVF